MLDFTATDIEPVNEELAAIKARFEEKCSAEVIDDAQLKRVVQKQADLNRELAEAK